MVLNYHPIGLIHLYLVVKINLPWYNFLKLIHNISNIKKIFFVIEG